jgi:FKBP-type peptidyl-prolyl cis-trans isomerase
MKLSVNLVAGVFILGCCAGFAGQETNYAAGAIPGPAFTEPQIIETWGWAIAQQQDVAGIEINKAELAALVKGFSANLSGRPAPYDLRKIFPDVERLAKARREKIVHATIQRNEAKATSFFNDLKQNPKVFDLSDGVRYEIVKPGSGPFARLEQTVNVHYTGRLIDGTEFSQMGPLDLVLVTNRSVCRGWVEALQLLNPGGTLKLYVPPPLSEEAAFAWGIEPGSVMVFEIELLAVRDSSPEDLANALLPPAPEPPPPPPSGYSDRQIIEAWGWNVGQQTGAARFKLAKADLALLAHGLASGVQGQSAPYDLQLIYPAVKQFVADHREKARLATRQQRLDEMNTLFDKLKKNRHVAELPNGVRYEIVKPGKGPYPKPGQIVLVDYTGRLVNGTVFDKTYNEPLHIEVGSVVPGWNEGIQKINKGGKLKLYIPPDVGYGDEDHSGVVAPIPANSVLIYEIELLDIQDKQ